MDTTDHLYNWGLGTRLERVSQTALAAVLTVRVESHLQGHKSTEVIV